MAFLFSPTILTSAPKSGDFARIALSFEEGDFVSRTRVFCVVLSTIVWASGFLGAQNTSGRPPITGIAKVSVYASDLSQSQHFYGAFLGFPLIGMDTHAASQHYRVNSAQSIEIQSLPHGETDNLAYIAFATTDAKALRRYLLAKKVRMEGEVHTEADGAQFFWVKDPEGHRIQFVQVPAHAHPLRMRDAKTSDQKVQSISHHILHAGFIVHDRAAEDRFYHDVLGFRSAWYGGMTDNRTDFVDMQVPDGADWLEYMLHSTGTPTARESGVLNHFALGVANIHQAADTLQQRGWQPSARSKAQIGRDGKWQLNLYDPDGTRVELMEFRPVRTPCCSSYTLKAPAPQP